MRTTEQELCQYFYLLIENPFSCYFLLSGDAVQPKRIYFDLLKVAGQLWWNQKKVNININYHNTHLPKSDLTTQIWF